MVAWDYRKAELNDADRALCDFAIQLTLAPGTMSENEIGSLRDHGFEDDQITVATQVIGYFNYITRLAAGLGVEPESWMDVPLDQWRREKGRDYHSSGTKR